MARRFVDLSICLERRRERPAGIRAASAGWTRAVAIFEDA